ncbi:MAG: PIN domain-containing protein [Caldisericaceae bacterium]|nr:PIN domain-containing protein [Caldisericaceae bacterium]
MKVLFDTNVILDVLLDREPFSEAAIQLLSMVERSEIIGFVCSTTITTIHYLTAKVLGRQAATQHICSLLSMFEISPVNRVVLEQALRLNFNDFEDAVLYASAFHTGVEYIVTRNVSDFKQSELPVFTPVEFINILDTLKNND